MSAAEDLKIALNVLSRVGLDGDLMSEFAKAKAAVHGLDSYNALQAQKAVPQSPLSDISGMGGQEILPESNMSPSAPVEPQNMV